VFAEEGANLCLICITVIELSNFELLCLAQHSKFMTFLPTKDEAIAS
jgi:hypothetical protein